MNGNGGNTLRAGHRPEGHNPKTAEWARDLAKVARR